MVCYGIFWSGQLTLGRNEQIYILFVNIIFDGSSSGITACTCQILTNTKPMIGGSLWSHPFTYGILLNLSKGSEILPKSTFRNCSPFMNLAHQTSWPCSTGYPGPTELEDTVKVTFPLFLRREVQTNDQEQKSQYNSRLHKVHT